MRRSSSGAAEGFPMARREYTTVRPSKNKGQLPPLVEAVPEIRHTKPSAERLYELPRASYESSIRPNEYSSTKSLAPSPLVQNRRNPSPTYERSMTPPQRSPVHLHASHHSSRLDSHMPLRSGPPNRSSGSSLSSEFSDRRGSLASAASSTVYPSPSSSATYTPYSNVSREQSLSAGLPALRTSSTGVRVEKEGFDQRNLPSLFGNSPGGPMSPYSQERAPLYGSHHSAAQNYPPSRQTYSLAAPEQQAYASGGDAQSPQFSYPPTPYADRPPYMNGSANGQYPLNFDTGSEYGEPKHKRRRGNLPKAVTDIMRAWFQDHIAHPYPTDEEKQILMHRTGLTISQISNWFINARRRHLPQMTKQAQAEAEVRDNQSGSRRSPPDRASHK